MILMHRWFQVGGEFTRHVVKYMNNSGRICQCGCISTYNLDTPDIYTGEQNFYIESVAVFLCTI